MKLFFKMVVDGVSSANVNRKWVCLTVDGFHKARHFLLVYVVFQGLYHTSRLWYFSFQVGTAHNDQSLITAKYIIIKFFAKGLNT